MIILTGSSLNKRHEEFNTKIKEAVQKNDNFEDLKDTKELSDVDKLFKIDLASKYKNIDYILDVLKSGDSLYISKALKCDWITDDEFLPYMNPEYLDQNIFPFMSSKMKKKLLATLSMHIRNGERAEEFHHYCMRNRMYKIGMGFLLYTNESFKIEILTLHPHVYNDFDRNEMYVEHFIGNSFLLAECYLKVVADSCRPKVLYKLRYLYSVSQNKYLDLNEKFHSHHHYQTSLRLSRDIMKKHKKRVLKYPWLYLSMINHKVVTKYSTSEDAKVYAIPFLPDTCSNFWNTDYYNKNKYFLDLIPMGERFSFIKNIYTQKYPTEHFEDNYNFFIKSYYTMMTEQEKEEWALRQIASEKELHGSGNDYIWYQFINFEKSFSELKKYILIAPDNEKRTFILKILVDSAKTQEELITLLHYYNNRHINELRDYKRDFLNKLVDNHKVLNFNDECWAALERIFYSLEVYHKLSEDNNDYQNNHYRVVSLTYYIIRDKPIPEVFNDYVITQTVTITKMRWSFENELDAEKLDKIFRYMLRCFTSHLESLIKSNTNKFEKNRYIHNIFDLIETFDKTIDDVPKIVNEHVMLDFEEFKHHQVYAGLRKPSPPEFRISDIMHYIKEDASLVVSKFPTIREYFQEKYLKNNINWLIRKLKIYFSNDIAQEYIKLLNECLSVEELYLQTARVAVFGIFNLADEEYKINFMKKYVPVDAKIDHVKISGNLLTIQTAICSVACHSRPPLPLSSFRDYIKGDYLQHCIYIFDSYLANLTPVQCISFVESLLDSPVSVQKHGLRLAFHCFSTINLKNLVLKVWKKAKNVSLRKTLYKALFDKVVYYHDNLAVQWELFEVLTTMTLDLHQDDDEEIFGLLTRELPSHLLGQHLKSAYTAVSSFPERTINFQRLTSIIQVITQNTKSIPKNILLTIMEDHINSMFNKNLIVNNHLKDGHEKLINAKWDLIKTFIIKHKDMNILRSVMDECLQIRWYKTHKSNYIYRRFWIEFVSDLENLSFNENTDHYLDSNDIFRKIVIEMEKAIPPMEIYVLVWQLNVNIVTRQVLGEEVHRMSTHDQDITKILIKEIILNFSNSIRNLMKEYIEKEKFFPLFYNDIHGVIRRGIYNLRDNLNRFVDKAVEVVDICVIISYVLLQYENREMHKFVMGFLPKNYHDANVAEYFNNVICKLLSLDDKEIKYFMCNKFYSSDYVHRDFMP